MWALMTMTVGQLYTWPPSADICHSLNCSLVTRRMWSVRPSSVEHRYTGPAAVDIYRYWSLFTSLGPLGLLSLQDRYNNEYWLRLERQRQVWFIPFVDKREDKTVRFLDNACHTSALLGWVFQHGAITSVCAFTFTKLVWMSRCVVHWTDIISWVARMGTAIASIRVVRLSANFSKTKWDRAMVNIKRDWKSGFLCRRPNKTVISVAQLCHSWAYNRPTEAVRMELGICVCLLTRVSYIVTAG